VDTPDGRTLIVAAATLRLNTAAPTPISTIRRCGSSAGSSYRGSKAPARVGAYWVHSVAIERGVAPIVIVSQLQKHHVLDWRTTPARNAPNVNDILRTW
jgi:hypothetical protein